MQTLELSASLSVHFNAMRPAPAAIFVWTIMLSAAISGCSRISPSLRQCLGRSVSSHPIESDPKDAPCRAHFSKEVEQIFANPPEFSHRVVTIPGLYLSGFEISSLFTCANGHTVELWVEDASDVRATAQIQLRLRERWYNPILRFKFDQKKNATAWEKLESQGNCSDVTLVGQFETKEPKSGGFGHLGAYTHELILLDALSTKQCDLHQFRQLNGEFPLRTP
jgi:hypothetical protein